MSRHQEIFDEITEILETEDYEPERFQEMCYELAEEIDDLREVIRACAAGPWRYDVENAPKDTPLQVWCKIHPANTGHDLRIGKLDSRSKTWTDGVWRLYVTAFAVPNPPQVRAYDAKA